MQLKRNPCRFHPRHERDTRPSSYHIFFDSYSARISVVSNRIISESTDRLYNVSNERPALSKNCLARKLTVVKAPKSSHITPILRPTPILSYRIVS